MTASNTTTFIDKHGGKVLSTGVALVPESLVEKYGIDVVAAICGVRPEDVHTVSSAVHEQVLDSPSSLASLEVHDA